MTSPTLPALLGYDLTNWVAQICAWCPPAERLAAERHAAVYGLDMTHGICPRCLSQVKKDLRPHCTSFTSR